jgi:cadherin-like protein
MRKPARARLRYGGRGARKRPETLGSILGSFFGPAFGSTFMSIKALACSLALILSFSLALSGCQTETPEAETVLWLQLNDSLSRYESILVQIVDRNDTDKVLATLWNKPLPAPRTDIQPFRLKTLPDNDFIVQILGYQAQQLTLHTQITYSGGKKTVLHKAVPILFAMDRLTKLTPSAGALSPAFDKDTHAYTLSIDQNELLSFSLMADNASAVVAFEGETVESGTRTKAVPVTEKTDTLTITVTDPASSPPSTRTYTIIVAPKPIAGLYLGSLAPSAGALSPEFNPTNSIYDLMLPAGVDTVAFTVSPADPRTMTMTVAGKALLPGERSETFKIEPSNSRRILFGVFRGSESNFYQVWVSQYAAPEP